MSLVRTFSLAFLIILGSHHTLKGAQGENKGRGLRQVSQESLEHVEKHWPVVVKVHPNKVGRERLAQHFGTVAAPTDTKEIEAVEGKEAALAAGPVESTPLPPSVNNSELPSFPPIGDQQQLGSCVAWASTYYQGTHEYGLLNGINNKTSFANVFSPKWTYDLLNNGQDNGLEIFPTYQLFAQSGYVNIVSFPYDTNFLAWDLNPQDWVAALNSRTGTALLVSGLGGDTQNLQAIKQLLNNGHVLTFGTYIDSWVFDNIQADPSSSSNPYAGQLAAIWMNGYDGGHCMTIIGYDDDVWLDINQNGVVDPGEKGAFLIANSWNTDWGNSGFVWVAYDAFLAQSAVANGPNNGRVPLGDALNSSAVTVVPLQEHYTPKLIAQFALTQTERDQISVSVGISDTNATTPAQKIQSYALLNQGGSYEFNGASPGSPETAIFSLDLTDLIADVDQQMQRFYLIVGDNQAGQPTTLQSFSLIDKVNQKQVGCTQIPKVCDNSSVTVYIDYDIANGTQPTPPPPPPPAPPSVSFNSPANNQKCSGNVWVVANVSDNVGIAKVEFYVDSSLKSTDRAAPYQILLNTGNLKKGYHQIKVIAYNTSGMTTSKTILIYAKK